MALSLPTNFENDIQGQNTSLVPVVYIGTQASDAEYIVISTNENPVTDKTLPVLLNIPSLKESIDIEKRNYKISNVTLDISNYEYEGKRFSEIVAGHPTISDSLVNVECRIFWTSPSASGIHFTPSEDNDSFLVYYGTIRKYDITSGGEKVKLVVEDRSQATLHIDLPKETFNDGDTIKYKPIVYGNVKNSPVAIDKSQATTVLWLDSSENVSLEIEPLGDTLSNPVPVAKDSLKIFTDDKYIMVASKIRKVLPSYSSFNADIPTEEGGGAIINLEDGTPQYNIDTSNKL